MGKNLADILNDALSFSGLFQGLNPAVFLQDPEEMGVKKEEINFSEWRFLGADLLVRGSYQIQGEKLGLVIRLFDVIHQKLLLKKIYANDLSAARQTILTFADEMMLHLTGELGIFHTQIAFVGNASGKKEIYLADFDGSNIRQITRDQDMNLAPAWAPDGKKISYVGYKRGNPDLYTMDLITKVGEPISMRPGLNIAPTLSFTGNPELYLLDARGEILKQLTINWSIDVSPSWAPDGQKLAYVSNRAGKPQIYLLDLATRRSTRLTFEGDYNTSPAWSPRGDRILYAGLHDGRFDIFMINPDGTELRQLTGGEGNNENPCWSPDGRLILFQSDRRGSPTLWVMQANGTDQRRLRLDLGGSQTEPDWSPRLTRVTP
jgi:TolB protein